MRQEEHQLGTEILKMLRETEEYVSGQQISERLGVSRTAVWKVIRRLREEGYEVEAVRNRGYRIIGSADVLNREALASLMRTGWAGRSLHYYEETDSTNLRIRSLADEGAPHGRWRWRGARQPAGAGAEDPGVHREGKTSICRSCSGRRSRRNGRPCSLW